VSTAQAHPRIETALPLAGLRVIDVGNFLAGPYAASIMGEFGAEVIKVEHPNGGDPMRRFGTASRDPDTTLNWLNEARNRKSITLNLLTPQGLEIFKRLIGKSDVLVENFRPGTAESWGLGWPEVHATNPSIVMLRVSGYGQTGPYRRRSGSGHIAQAFGGLNYLAGFPGETPVLPGTCRSVTTSRVCLAPSACSIALRHKDQTGRGQLVDVGTYEAILRVLEEIAPAYALYRQDPRT
jgi:succinyl-CoA:(S)-malate CoA-transferase subunit A